MTQRLPLADAALRLALTYHQVHARVLRGDLKGGRDDHGRLYVDAAEVQRVLRDEPRHVANT